MRNGSLECECGVNFKELHRGFDTTGTSRLGVRPMTWCKGRKGLRNEEKRALKYRGTRIIQASLPRSVGFASPSVPFKALENV